MAEKTKERYYVVPKIVFKKGISMFEILSIIFTQKYKDFNNESVFTIATLLTSFNLEVHHRKIAHVKDCLISLSDMGIIEINISNIIKADKNTFISTIFNDYFENGFIAIHPIEFNIILKTMNYHNNYNLLNVFITIKQDTTTINYLSNTYSSTSISYKSLCELSGIKSPNNLQEAIGILCDIGVMGTRVSKSGNKTKNEYSFKTVSELKKLINKA